ncbi:MAG: flagellin [Cyanobacteria bacterium RYN_339]|nr:flagellin [Cyanobacteria bacterium RYN_339]
MSLRINTNISAINTHRAMQMNDLNLSKSLEKLSSGLRINRASDDAAGLSISETLRGQVRGLAQAEKNAQDGISLINTAEGALNEIHSILQRMRELAVQSSNGTLTTSDRLATDSEFQTLKSEIDNITSYTSFNTMSLLNGDPVTPATPMTFTFQVGANFGQTLVVGVQSVCAAALTLTAATVDTANQTDAMSSITSLDVAIQAVSSVRSNLGAISNRLEHTINNVAASRENLSAAESRIRDVDMADEMTTMTRNQILMQSATAMLAQANAQPQSVLSLFK